MVYLACEHDDRYMSVCFRCFFFFSLHLQTFGDFFRTLCECHLKCISIVIAVIVVRSNSVFSRTYFRNLFQLKKYRERERENKFSQKWPKTVRNKSDTKLKVNQKSVFLSTKRNELLRLYLYLPIQTKYSHFIYIFFCSFHLFFCFHSFLAIIISMRKRANQQTNEWTATHRSRTICTVACGMGLSYVHLIFSIATLIYGKIILIN